MLALGSLLTVHGPHMHCDGPIRLDHSFPNLGQDDLSVRAYQVIMALLYMGTNNVNVLERLLDQVLHALHMLAHRHKDY